jgi:hypothetical protein
MLALVRVKFCDVKYFFPYRVMMLLLINTYLKKEMNQASLAVIRIFTQV